MRTRQLSSTVKTRTKEHLNSGSEAIESLDEVSKTTLSVMTGISGMIGIWAVACLIGAAANLGNGPLQLAQSWFSAVTGL